jgi:hypothetical protein
MVSRYFTIFIILFRFLRILKEFIWALIIQINLKGNCEIALFTQAQFDMRPKAYSSSRPSKRPKQAACQGPSYCHTQRAGAGRGHHASTRLGHGVCRSNRWLTHALLVTGSYTIYKASAMCHHTRTSKRCTGDGAPQGGGVLTRARWRSWWSAVTWQPSRARREPKRGQWGFKLRRKRLVCSGMTLTVNDERRRCDRRYGRYRWSRASNPGPKDALGWGISLGEWAWPEAQRRWTLPVVDGGSKVLYFGGFGGKEMVRKIGHGSVALAFIGGGVVVGSRRMDAAWCAWLAIGHHRMWAPCDTDGQAHVWPGCGTWAQAGAGSWAQPR